MAFEFKETLEITLPDFDRSLEFLESTKEDTKQGLIVEFAAIHVGATANFNYYSQEALEGSITSWTEPYPKPVILNHDPMSESIGRIIGSRMDIGEDGTPFVRLQAAITDPVAIQKLKDKRFLTGSVGGKADEAVCTICDTNWAAEEGICKHRKGKVYNGKVAFLKMGKIKFKEYSMVNMPADDRSTVLTMSEGEEAPAPDAAECFVIDMENESISRISESGEALNVLSEMKKKEALPIYMGLKGSFLTAMALQESENTTNLTKDIENSETDNTNKGSNKISEENLMSKTVEQTEEKDLLDVVEGLAEETDAANDDAASDEVVDETPSEDAETGDEEEAKTEDETPTDEAEGDKKPEGQEKGGNKDVDPETSDGAPPSREGDAEDEGTEEAPKTEEEPEADKDSEETDSNSELVDEGEADEVDEPHEDEDDSSELDGLREENARLRKALHRMLAERVVDAKIAAGIAVGERKDAIAEHSERSADSLADSLRDLASMPVVTPTPTTERITPAESEVAATDKEKGAVFDDVEEGDEEVEEGIKSAEDFLVDAFMGRKPL